MLQSLEGEMKERTKKENKMGLVDIFKISTEIFLVDILGISQGGIGSVRANDGTYWPLF